MARISKMFKTSIENTNEHLKKITLVLLEQITGQTLFFGTKVAEIPMILL